MLLHIAVLPLPVFSRAAEGHDVMEVTEVMRYEIEEIFVVNICWIARAVHEVNLLVLMMRWIGKQPLNKSADGSDAGAGCDQDGIAQRIAQYKSPVRTVEFDRLSFFQVTE